MALKRKKGAPARIIPPLPEEKITVRPSRRAGPRSQQSGGPDAVALYLAGFNKLLRSLRTVSKKGRERSNQPARSQASPYSQRCAIRFSYSPNQIRGHFAAHARYLVRDSAAGGSRPYGSAGVENMVETLGRWQSQGDKRLYKIIVSPEFGDRMNLTVLASNLMGEIERDMHRKLEWGAVNHNNTDHPHIHIAIRSVDQEGREFRFSREFIKNTIREHAQALCTEQLGHRTLHDAELASRREVEQFRPTSIDRAIFKSMEGSAQDPALGGSLIRTDNDLWKARLQFLASAGLVQRQSVDAWIVPGDLSWTLQHMAVASDRQRMLAKSGVAISDDKIPQARTVLSDQTGILRGRVLANVEEEQNGQMHLILEGTDGVIHFIRHDRAITDRRDKGQLKPNHFASFQPTSKGVRIIDLGNADSYLNSSTFDATPLPSEAASASHPWRGWLGRYHQQLDLTIPQGGAERAPEIEIPEKPGDFER